MPYLVDIKTSFPKNYYTQASVKERLLELWKDEVKNLSRIEKILDNVMVKGRHLSMELDQYFEKKDFGQKNSLFIDTATKLAAESISDLLFDYDLRASNISSLWSNTVTGFAIPSLDARVMNMLPFSNDTKRVPMMGLGCMAGVSGVNRVCDYLKGSPNQAAIFFTVELCSLTMQPENFSLANIVSTCLFGDGAAAVLIVGDDHPLAKNGKLEFIDSQSCFFPDTEEMMGWHVDENGLNVKLSKSVPQITKEKVPGLIREFLHKNKMSRNEISTIFAHPGGPKVLLAMEEALELGSGDLTHSWQSLQENGNMSSVSVLDITKRHFTEREVNKLSYDTSPYCLNVAMGPAFSAEVGMFRWN